MPLPNCLRPDCAKLTRAQVAEIRILRAYADCMTLKEIGAAFGVSAVAVWKVEHGFTWRL